MKKEMIKRNIENLKSWVIKQPNDEDYKRLLSEFEKELENMN